jgi:hypothetical protein
VSRIPADILKLLKDAREAATLETASFDWPDSHMTAKCRSGDFDGRPSEFIKERVRIHHSTWIINRLDRAIEWAERAPVSRPQHSPPENPHD